MIDKAKSSGRPFRYLVKKMFGMYELEVMFFSVIPLLLLILHEIGFMLDLVLYAGLFLWVFTTGALASFFQIAKVLDEDYKAGNIEISDAEIRVRFDAGGKI